MSTNYYQIKKHLYRERYYENKRKEQEKYELFKEYDGEKTFYKQQYIKTGFLIIKNLYPSDGGAPKSIPPEPVVGGGGTGLGAPKLIVPEPDVDGVDAGGELKLIVPVEATPVVAVVDLAGTAGADGLTATDCCCGTDLVDGAIPVVG